MARILGNPFGELRGKAGGSVFSRNRAGQFMRVYVKPAQANSTSQATARGIFGAASQAYVPLTLATKGSWGSFATSVYNPLKKTNVGQFTGQQAFIGIISSVTASASKIAQGTWCTIGTTTLKPNTVVAFTNGTNAPSTTVVPAVQGPAGSGVQPLGIVNVTAANKDSLKFDLLFGATGSGILAGQMLDSGGKAFTIGVYYSDVLRFSGSTPKNKYQNFVGNLAIPSFTTPFTNGVLGVTVNMTGIVTSGMKRIPASGDIYLVTFLSIGIDGTQATIDSKYVIVA